MNEKEHLSVREVARKLGISPKTVYILIRSGELPAVKLRNSKNSSWRIPADALAKYIETHSSGRQ